MQGYRQYWCVEEGGVVVLSAGHECVGDTRSLGTVSSTADVQGMSVVRVMRGVGGVCVVCEMCMCLARGGVGGERGEWIRGLGLGFTNNVGTGECWMCVCV